MKGIAKITEKGWAVEYNVWEDDRTYQLPIFPIGGQYLEVGEEVEFDLYHIKDFSDTINFFETVYAKIKK